MASGRGGQLCHSHIVWVIVIVVIHKQISLHSEELDTKATTYFYLIDSK